MKYVGRDIVPFYISNPNKYIIDPSPGQHLNSAPSINVLHESTVMQKLLLCLDIAEQYERKMVNLHLVGSATEDLSKTSDWIIKGIDGLGFINTDRALKGKINRPYHWTSIKKIKNKYLPRIKELKRFGVSFDNFACARCASIDGISEAIQIAGNEKGVTILYIGIEENKVKEIFQKFLKEGIVLN